MSKVCSCCKEEKELLQFNRDSSKNDGHRAMCKVCWNTKKIYHNAKHKGLTYGMNEEELKQYREFQSMIGWVKTALKEFELETKEEPRWKTHNAYTCFMCKTEKALSMFYKDSRSNTGHDRKCKECSLVGAANRTKRYRKTDNGKQKAAEYRKTELHKLHSRLGRSKRRALERNINQNFNGKDAKEVMQRFNHSCFKCGNKDNLHIDHHVPLSKGGRLTFTNTVILCAVCNVRKSNQDPEQFYSQREINILSKQYGVRRDSLFN